MDDPEFRREVNRIVSDAEGLKPSIVTSAQTYYDGGGEAFRSSDRHTTIIQFTMAGDPDQARKRVSELMSVVRANNGPFVLGLTGTDAMHHDLEILAEHDLKHGDAIGLAMALVVLLVVFGTLAAASLPVVLAFATIVLALGLTAIVAQAVDLSSLSPTWSSA